MKFSVKLVGLLDVELILRVGEEKLPKIPLADRIFHCLRGTRELREVKRVAIEDDHRRIALADLVALYKAFLEDQISTTAIVKQFADFRQNSDAFVRIAPIVEVYSGKMSIWTSLANVDRDAA